MNRLKNDEVKYLEEEIEKSNCQEQTAVGQLVVETENNLS